MIGTHADARRIYTEIAVIWEAEINAARENYALEDEMFIHHVPRGYMPATPYERWFVTGNERESGGLFGQEEREQMRAEFLEYCKMRVEEYARLSIK